MERRQIFGTKTIIFVGKKNEKNILGIRNELIYC
jgi:hypothetical protein